MCIRDSFEGKQQSKIWLVAQNDLGKLHELHPNGGQVLLWYDGVSEIGNTECRAPRRNTEADSAASKCSQQESDVESVFKELRESINKHGIYLG